eukprot:Clim_evm254s157 gene=Clim_evmTU254s157
MVKRTSTNSPAKTASKRKARKIGTAKVTDPIFPRTLGFIQGPLTQPAKFLRADQEVAQHGKEALKELFDLALSHDRRKYTALSEFIIDGLDAEQLWEELLMRNKPALSQLRKDMSNVQKDIEANKVAERTRRQQVEVEAKDHLAEYDSDEEVNDMVNGRALQGDDDSEYDERDVQNEEEDEEDSEVDATDFGEEMIRRQVTFAKGTKEFDAGEEDDDDDDDRDIDPKNRKVKYGTTEVDDKYFSLAEMENFVREAEEEADDDDMDNNEDDDDDSIDYNVNMDDDDEDINNLRAEQFFRLGQNEVQDTKQQLLDDDEDEGDLYDDEDAAMLNTATVDGVNAERRALLFDSDGNDLSVVPEQAAQAATGLSRHEKEQLKVGKQIEELERRNAEPKSWQMSGETIAKARPENALLEEFMEIDYASKPAPEPTEEHTEEIEEIINRRIRDQVFDDPVRQNLLAEDGDGKFKPQYDVSAEKSKQSLAQVYEEDYQARLEGTTVAQKQVSKELQEKHDAITEVWTELARKLDALSNMHYTPKAAKDSVEVITQAPALAMEEVQPTAMSTADRLAPEEVYKSTAKTGRDEPKAAEERSKTDRLRARRKKKAAQKAKAVAQEAHVRAGGELSKADAEKRLLRNNRNVFKGINSRDKGGDRAGTGVNNYSSSTAFFKALQNQVQEDMAGKKAKRNARDQPGGSRKKASNRAGAAVKL